MSPSSCKVFNDHSPNAGAGPYIVHVATQQEPRHLRLHLFGNPAFVVGELAVRARAVRLGPAAPLPQQGRAAPCAFAPPPWAFHNNFYHLRNLERNPATIQRVSRAKSNEELPERAGHSVSRVPFNPSQIRGK